MNAADRAEFVARKAAGWGVPLWEAEAYVTHVDTNRYFAVAIMMPFSIHGQPGMMVATSTAESTSIHKQNVVDHDLGRGIQDPAWMHFQMHWYDNLAFLNWNGMHDAAFNGQRQPYLLGAFLREACMRKRIDFNVAVFSGPERSPLRSLLMKLGLLVWAEITVGVSFHAFRALDV